MDITNKKQLDLSNPRILDAFIQVGSQVVAVDGSYTLSIVDNELKQISFGLIDNIQTVIAINVPCPSAFNDLDILIDTNNCIVRDNVTGIITFCSKINIRNIKQL